MADPVPPDAARPCAGRAPAVRVECGRFHGDDRVQGQCRLRALYGEEVSAATLATLVPLTTYR